MVFCIGCQKEKSKIKFILPNIEGRVCDWCYRKWRLENEPDYKAKVKLRQSLYAKTSKAKAQRAAWKKNNPEKIRISREKYYLNNREKCRKSIQKWFENNPGYMNRYVLDRQSRDLIFRLQRILRDRFLKAIKNDYKTGSAIKDLGCSVEEFKQYLESKFKPGMTWGNYGKYGWHIDHIKPLFSFNLQNREEVIKALNFTNLQPLWWNENLSKGSKTIGVQNGTN